MSVIDAPPTTRTTADRPGPDRTCADVRDWARRAPLLPALIFMFVITQLPFVATLVISFVQWNALRPDLGKSFTGLSNYQAVLADPDFRSSIYFTDHPDRHGGAGQPVPGPAAGPAAGPAVPRPRRWSGRC